jgi:hypothetical protein
MARCAHCQAETELYHGPRPICVRCADLPPGKLMERARLFNDVREATALAEFSANAFAAITGDIPSRLPHPDGMQRIRNASNEMKLAREAMIKAHNRLIDYLERGFVPEDLKRSDPDAEQFLERGPKADMVRLRADAAG